MRVLNGILSIMLIGFALVQYNDPDIFLWVPIYGIPAAWRAMAAYRPQRARRRSSSAALTACIAVAIVGTVISWPTEAGFWRREVWWDSETAREGMGLMIVTVSLLVAAATDSLAGRSRG